jgi:diphosphomevalonate decarboxylase
MGKAGNNVTGIKPYNVSLSYTLHRLYTKVSLESCSSEDCFINEIGLDQKAVDRFLLHLKCIKKIFRYSGFFRIRSFNNFPHSAGIASSSSSFAALTKCAATALCDITGLSPLSPEHMSEISRMSSGASCRSFFSPWSVWNREGAAAINLKIGELDHDLVLIDQSPKKISSGEAHNFVKSSPLFKGRILRTQRRFESLTYALDNAEWNDACQICTEEFLDMHRLFETAVPSFGYMQPKTYAVLDEIRKFHKINGDGPICTVDAGPNIHLLWRKNQEEMRNELKKTVKFQMQCEIL